MRMRVCERGVATTSKVWLKKSGTTMAVVSASPAPMEDVKVLEALTKAYVSPFTSIFILFSQSLPVLYARKAMVKFNSREMDSPLPRYTFSFQPGDYLHFKQARRYTTLY